MKIHQISNIFELFSHANNKIFKKDCFYKSCSNKIYKIENIKNGYADVKQSNNTYNVKILSNGFTQFFECNNDIVISINKVKEM